jgi:hypothetical protein
MYPTEPMIASGQSSLTVTIELIRTPTSPDLVAAFCIRLQVIIAGAQAGTLMLPEDDPAVKA